jgi:hypothetical protein
MKFDLVAPCSDCPFLKEGGIRLNRDRMAEIAGYTMSDHNSKMFACHKTTGAERGKRVPAQNHSHCAGALIFGYKQGQRSQIHQIMERLGRYDSEKLVGHERVFDTLEEMLEESLD